MNSPLPSAKHEAFAKLVAKGEYAAEAYRAVYRAKPSVAETNGPRLLRTAQVRARVTALQKQVEQGFTMKRVEWLESFARVAAKAEAVGDYAACVGALRQIGLALPQWYQPAQHEHDGKLEIVIRKL